ncbi:cytochrome c oxidase assembly protein [Burkholderia glumae]|uniref:Cytochrome c oxidase assembly protein CtaG n=1 Tax=Burkholderia glumae TaxID=337 RepID=A0AAP9Y1Z8_BURGL|nr:cytochrome c oxidase assembly protein [Burkholderia glumae]ACR30229.1 Cytochrome c oxidase assembly protein CtaG/Cox11 [Burkholderia glumae BGR1]AJY66781.1 cytochrome c oxidase assembly CtaG/Cox11 family protein [Burkholderia glumae LMG 2196 = ATCC 33617]KHJ64901.1 cytochrome C oxidase assembly protein [Burkholderia glumae]MCM2482125.1 cytochrome c oxidase assembly protein [Burkholderia glumae]MCM2491278.1 cytochrome c oxidase assembly protein [Burkholderia glumae]
MSEPVVDADSSFNRTMLLKLAVVAALMFGFGFALVPIYRAICQVTGLNNLVQRDVSAREARNTQVDASRTISVELDANARGPLGFRPEQRSLDVHPGEVMTVVYEVTNAQDRQVVAQAIPSYAPKQATEYFKKIECFCFTQQTLKPNESRRMPVVFVVDRALPKDVKTITLSYTFFELSPPAAAAGPGSKRGA